MRVKLVKKIQQIYFKIISFLDYKKGFGGQFGIQKDRVDKSAAGWEDHEQLTKHESQVGKRRSKIFS